MMINFMASYHYIVYFLRIIQIMDRIVSFFLISSRFLIYTQYYYTFENILYHDGSQCLLMVYQKRINVIIIKIN